MNEAKMLEAMLASNLTPEEFGALLATAGAPPKNTWDNEIHVLHNDARWDARERIRKLPHGTELLASIDACSKPLWGRHTKRLS